MSVSLPPIASPAQRSGMMDVVPPSAAERAALFRKFDPSGNGLLSLGEATAAVHQEFPFFSDQKAIKQAFVPRLDQARFVPCCTRSFPRLQQDFFLIHQHVNFAR